MIAGLLHDTVEDTTVTLDDLKTEFGDEIAKMVDGVTKLSNLPEFRAAIMLEIKIPIRNYPQAHQIRIKEIVKEICAMRAFEKPLLQWEKMSG